MLNLDIGFSDIIDIVLASVLIYQTYRLVRGTAAMRILLGMAAIYLAYLGVNFLEMGLTSTILGSFMSVGLVVLVIVFQQEIRKFLLVIGSATFGTTRQNFVKRVLRIRDEDEGSPSLIVSPISKALLGIAKQGQGALIVIEVQDPLGSFNASGHRIDARPTKILLETIFFKNSPLHDGATIISRGKISAAGAVLPLSENTDLPVQFGLRHRAAVGITEITDAIAVTVSEETGKIHFFENGKHMHVAPHEVMSKLAEMLAQNTAEETPEEED